jgi:hypothetical protein
VCADYVKERGQNPQAPVNPGAVIHEVSDRWGHVKDRPTKRTILLLFGPFISSQRRDRVQSLSGFSLEDSPNIYRGRVISNIMGKRQILIIINKNSISLLITGLLF